jgi:hypothetical protein
MERKVNEIYQELLRLLKVVIERDFRSCSNLEEHLKAILHDLAYEAAEENWAGWKIIVSGVFKAVEQARYLAEKYDKDFCYYLEMALKRGWIENWIHQFREAMFE